MQALHFRCSCLPAAFISFSLSGKNYGKVNQDWGPTITLLPKIKAYIM